MNAIDIDDVGALRQIRINRPDRRNSLRPADVSDLIAALDEAARADHVRCIVLGGRGGHFSSGGDLSEGVAVEPRGAERMVRDYQRIVQSILDMPVPVVTVLEGAVVGAAAAFVLASDVCVAAPQARILLPAVMRGFVPDAGTAFLLSRTLGPARTKALLLGNGAVTARQAHEWGLIAEVDDDPWAIARAWAERLADGPTTTILMTRRLINDASYAGLAESLLLERTAMQASFGTSEPAEGIAAFRERRDPVFAR